jgi:hypothetical protein
MKDEIVIYQIDELTAHLEVRVDNENCLAKSATYFIAV